MITKEKHIFYFIGIGGVGMSALARLCFRQGHRVFGYDKTPSEITQQLIAQGIAIEYDEAVSALSSEIMSPEVIVIYTAAIPENHPQLSYFKKLGNLVIKRAKFLAELCSDKKTLAVAGTHGKTTTSLILTHIFSETKQSFTSVMGGFFNNDSSNLIQKGEDKFIVEADEYDRSFLHLHPNIACITSLEADHLDIYKTETAFKEAFERFSEQVKQVLIVAYGIPLSGLTYGIDVEADYKAFNLTMTARGYQFDLRTPSGIYYNVNFNQLGVHNVSNALGAIAMADQAGINMKQALLALERFPGVSRRMNVYHWKNTVLIDDYAHHPTEIESVFETIKSFYPKQKNCVIFQPHLFSRTQDFMKEFSLVLSKFDEVVLMDIYPAREAPISGINASSLLDLISHDQKICIHKTEIKNVLETTEASVVALLGAGDIGAEIQQLKSLFTER